MMKEDLALVRDYVVDRSEQAFETLVSRYINLVYSTALREVRDSHLAEEIAQAVFIIFAKKAGKLGPDTILPSWLHRTAVFVSADALRAHRNRARREQEAHMRSLLDEPAKDLWPQIAPLLDHAIVALNKKDRHAIVLRFFHGKSFREIGMALGANEDAAKMRVSRALDKLRKYFSARGIDSTSATISSAISTHSIQAAPAALAKTAAVVALTKGATASLSIATLAKGALAWSKVQIAVAVGGAILLAAGTSVVTTGVIHWPRLTHGPDLQGTWEGLMLSDEAGVGANEAARIHVVLKLTKSNDVYRATSDWVELGRKDVSMGKVTYDYPYLKIEQTPRNEWLLLINEGASQMILSHSIHFTEPDPVLFMHTAVPDTVPGPLAERDFATRASSDLQGYWKGIIGEGPDALPVNLKIAQKPDGTFRGEADSFMRGANGLPLAVTYRRPSVKIALASGAGTFEGRINATHTEISGLWIQSGESKPAIAKRADYQAEHAHDADRNYAFASEDELQGHWTGTWTLLMADKKILIRMALDIAKLPDGSYSAALINIDEFGHEAPIPPSEFQFSAPNLQAKWKWPDRAYEGKLENGKLTGTWLQGGGGFPLVFERDK